MFISFASHLHSSSTHGTKVRRPEKVTKYDLNFSCLVYAFFAFVARASYVCFLFFFRCLSHSLFGFSYGLRPRARFINFACQFDKLPTTAFRRNARRKTRRHTDEYPPRRWPSSPGICARFFDHILSLICVEIAKKYKINN